MMMMMIITNNNNIATIATITISSGATALTGTSCC
jgi:hypothetical protein